MYFYLPKACVDSVAADMSDHLFSMRVMVGDVVVCTDLLGTLRHIKIQEVDKKSRTIRFTTLDTTVQPPNNTHNILFQGLTDKIYLEKLVEIAPHANIDIIYLFPASHTPSGSFSMERLDKILIRSCEQAQKLFKPTIELLSLETATACIAKYLPTVLEMPNKSVKQTLEKTDHVTTKSVIVGPEGGWSSEEIQLFQQHQLPFESLGSVVYPSWLAGYTWFTQQQAIHPTIDK
jgi:RsmE family RNA methyltransferase